MDRAGPSAPLTSFHGLPGDEESDESEATSTTQATKQNMILIYDGFSATRVHVMRGRQHTVRERHAPLTYIARVLLAGVHAAIARTA